MHPPALPRLADLTSAAFAALRAAAPPDRPLVALLPVGSVEPHGPHLPLGTDTLISEAACRAAAPALAAVCTPILAPALPYGVTECARAFPGALSLPPAALTACLRAITSALLDQGFFLVCLVNNHLEPDHDAAVRAAAAGLRAVVACPLSRRWGRTLSAEFKHGSCHAGRYETSLILASDPALVDAAAMSALPPVPVSLAEKLRAGISDFREMGLSAAYAGAPAEATPAEGRELLDRLAAMIAGEVADGLASHPPAPPAEPARAV